MYFREPGTIWQYHSAPGQWNETLAVDKIQKHLRVYYRPLLGYDWPYFTFCLCTRFRGPGGERIHIISRSPMRMWGVNPEWMCRQHLLGEHKELHMMVGSIAKGRSIAGFIDRGHIDTRKIQTRHDQIVKEMLNRGYNHKTPMKYKDELAIGALDIDYNLEDLRRRCPRCAMRYLQWRFKNADKSSSDVHGNRSRSSKKKHVLPSKRRRHSRT